MQDHVIETKRVFAGPAKQMFIDVLTRDVSLVPAILDLVDNSVDSANSLIRRWAAEDKHGPSAPRERLTIDVTARPDRFEVRDNCEGISVEAASSYVFALGRPHGSGAARVGGSIGRFGVGMKRTLFKVSDSFTVRSATDDTLFEVSLNVDDWMAKRTPDGQDDWYIPMRVMERDKNAPRGTSIVVNTLKPWVSEAFEELPTINGLRDELRSRHRMAIERGIEIRLNGATLAPLPSQLGVGEGLSPSYRSFEVAGANGSPIAVRIFAGMVGATTHSGIGEEPEDRAEAERPAGWYVFGNGRLIVGPDKTPLTGWAGGRDLPRYHNQYSRFRGYVLMEADDVFAMPWTTDKTSIEPDDRAWLKIRREMVLAGEPVINHLNGLKREVSAPDAVAHKPISAALQASRTETVSTLAPTMTEDRDAVAPEENPETRAGRGVRIAYVVDPEDFAEVAAGLGTDTKKVVGERTFAHYLEVAVRGRR